MKKSSPDHMENNLLDTYIRENIEKAIEAKSVQIPPAKELHHEFSPEFYQKMDDLIQKDKQSASRRKIIHYLKNTAAALLLFCTIGFGFAMSVEAYREQFLNFIIQKKEQFIEICIESDLSESENLTFIEPSELPDDYYETEHNQTENQLIIVYQADDNECITYRQSLLTSGDLIIDTENISTEQLDINNTSIYVIYKNDFIRFYWQSENYLFQLNGPDYLKDDLLHMIDSIISFD